MSTLSTSEYLAINLKLASQLLGKQIQSITRLSYLEPRFELRKEIGSILLESFDGIRLYIDVDEGMANIIIFDASNLDKPINQKIDEFPYKRLIFPAKEERGEFTSLLTQTIANIDVISRENEDYSFYSMCGFRLNFPDCSSLCIGTYLTTAKIPGAWILTPEEVDVSLHYQPLTAKSE